MAGLRYGSVCSGIEAATVAWHPLGWQPQFFSEIDAAPRAVLSHHYPEVPLHGDFTTIQDGQYGTIDLLVGGTPCQSFSVAGLRGGLADDRGNLALQYLRLAQRLRPRWLVWENVPGVLSSNGGRDFGAILGGMGELGYGVAYRVLDAQYMRTLGFERAVPQRRRRVFVVGYLGDWRRAAAVLFERASLRGDLAPRREAGAIAAASLTGSLGRRCGQPDGGDTNGHLIAGVSHSLRAEGFDASEDGTGRGTPIVPIAFGGNDTRGPIDVATALSAHGGPCGRMDFESETFVAQTLRARDSAKGVDSDCTDALLPIAFDTTQITSAANRCNPQAGDPCHPLASGAHPPAIAFNSRQDPDVTWDRAGSLSSSSPQAEAIAYDLRNGTADDVAMSLQSGGMGEDRGICPNAIPHTLTGWAVRRLTPLECERLQGFPDGYTLVPTSRGMMADGPRYKSLGNSMAVNAMRWIGRRIEAVEQLSSSIARAARLPPQHHRAWESGRPWRGRRSKTGLSPPSDKRHGRATKASASTAERSP
ncbi:DNA cytosine methyltransferase [Methylobacterium sp. CM6247]